MIEGLAGALKQALLILFAVAILVMGLTLLLVFRSRWRLLPLAIALAAAALTFGLLSLFGGSLTIASIATLPILIGLVVDYAIQFRRAMTRGSWGRQPMEGARGGPRRSDDATAGLATAAGSWPSSSRRFRWCGASASCSSSVLLGPRAGAAAGFAALGLRPGTEGGGCPSACWVFRHGVPSAR